MDNEKPPRIRGRKVTPRDLIRDSRWDVAGPCIMQCTIIFLIVLIMLIAISVEEGI